MRKSSQPCLNLRETLWWKRSKRLKLRKIWKKVLVEQQLQIRLISVPFKKLWMKMRMERPLIELKFQRLSVPTRQTRLKIANISFWILKHWWKIRDRQKIGKSKSLHIMLLSKFIRKDHLSNNSIKRISWKINSSRHAWFFWRQVSKKTIWPHTCCRLMQHRSFSHRLCHLIQSMALYRVW